MDSGEKRLNELGYKQELRREMTQFKTMAITFSCISAFSGTPLYGQSLRYAGPATLVWGWMVVSFFTWFVAIAMAEICSSFPTTGSLYFWAAHLAGPRWGPFASWCCAWLETIGVIFAIGAQAYSGSQALQMIILLATGTNKGGGYFASKGVFLCLYMALILIWAVLNTFKLQVIAFLNIISIWWQVAGGLLVIVMLPLVAQSTQPASYVFTHFETSPESTGVSSILYAVILSVLLSIYSLFGYDAAAHLTEETKGADRTGPKAILSSLGIISVFGWAYYLSLTFSIRDLEFQNSTGAVVFLCIIWGSYFFCGLSTTTTAARVVHALSRDNGIPFSPIWRKLHPRTKVPTNAVWLCAAIGLLLGLPILKLDVVFVGGNFPTRIFAQYSFVFSASLSPCKTDRSKRTTSEGYWPKALRCLSCRLSVLFLTVVMLWWALDARNWFKGPVRNIDVQNENY
ncbi:hypothetical protein L3X38_008115 [Prunus dulcis]|uniref:Uncharacterized protein n=1 Tax=Prunus dulcis TaxID=3755 RepID=A0AAD5F6T9_PRUDU|nr:hypothetical protein L3X38_008115 [Prunus dulcis]